MEGLARLTRFATILEDGISLTDSFDYTGDGKVVSRIAVVAQPSEVKAGEVVAGDVTLFFDPEKCSVALNSEAVNAQKTVYYVDFTPADGVSEINVRLKV